MFAKSFALDGKGFGVNCNLVVAMLADVPGLGVVLGEDGFLVRFGHGASCDRQGWAEVEGQRWIESSELTERPLYSVISVLHTSRGITLAFGLIPQV